MSFFEVNFLYNAHINPIPNFFCPSSSPLRFYHTQPHPNRTLSRRERAPSRPTKTTFLLSPLFFLPPSPLPRHSSPHAHTRCTPAPPLPLRLDPKIAKFGPVFTEIQPSLAFSLFSVIFLLSLFVYFLRTPCLNPSETLSAYSPSPPGHFDTIFGFFGFFLTKLLTFLPFFSIFPYIPLYFLIFSPPIFSRASVTVNPK